VLRMLVMSDANTMEQVTVPRVSFDFHGAIGASAITRERSKSLAKRAKEKSVKKFEFEAVEARSAPDLVPLSEQDMVFSIQFEKRKQAAGLNFSKYFFLNSVTEWTRK
jgi:hypothetical protein